MYKLVIIDDEEEIRNGLCLFVKSTQPDFNITGIFDDGKKAIRFIKDNGADLVITDIKMSDTSGLDVLRFLKSDFPDTKIIVISGYQNFNFSKVALECKASFYLTKPTRHKILKEAFSKITEELKMRDELKSKTESDNKKLDYLKEVFFSDVYKKEITKINLNKMLDMIDSDNVIKNSKFIILSAGISESKINEELFIKLKKEIEVFLNKYDISSECIYKRDGILKFILYTEKYKEVSEFTNEMMKNILNLKEIILKEIEININFYISRAYNSIDDFYNDKRYDLSSLRGMQISSDIDTIFKAKEYILQNIASDISLKMVAKHLYMNPSYFSRYFKTYIGMNFSEYLIKLRISLAKELIEEGKTKLSDIAYKVGYKDSAYFSKSFKQITNMTPNEYYRKVRESDEK